MTAKEDKDATGSGTEDRATPTQMMEDAAALQAHGFDKVTNMGVAWIEALSDMGSEVMSFVAERIKEDVHTQHRLLHCKDMEELHKIQADFVQTAIDQYRAETGKLVEMSHKLEIAPENDSGTS
jgi:hypothetical protein